MLAAPNAGTHPSGEWFRRRPCFWWAAALAMGAATVPHWLPVPWLVAAGVTGALSLWTAARRALASCLLMFTIGGCLPAWWDNPQYPSNLEPGRAVRVRGVIERVVSVSQERSSLVVRCQERRTPEGWVPQRMLLGVSGPPEARPGERVELSGLLEAPYPATNPGGFDARRYWLTEGVALRLDPHERGYRTLAAPSERGWEGLGRLVQQWVQRSHQRTLSPRAAVIADRFLVGSHPPHDLEIVADLDRTFREAGTIHLLVVSGAQVSAVLCVLLWLGKRLWRFRYPIWLLGLGALVVYYTATGGDASLSRAAVFGAIVVLGLALLREVDGENALGLTLLVLAAAQPAMLLDVGAQLSFTAVWGLLRLAPALERAFPGADEPAGMKKEPPFWGVQLRRIFCANLAAHLLTAPILAYHFQTSCWVALVSNCCVFLTAAALLPVCCLHLLLSQLGLPLLAPLVTALGDALYGWSSLFGSSAWGAVPAFPPPFWLLPVYFGLAWSATLLPARSRWGVVGGLVAVLLVSERLPAPAPGMPVVRAIDVGQGDSVLLQGTDGTNLLVDAGPPPLREDRLPLAQALRGLRVARLDAVVVSHAHADHIGGLAQLMREVPVGTLIYSSRIQDVPMWREVLEAAARHRVQRMEVSAGDRVSIGRAALAVLAPGTRSGVAHEDPNEESLVVRWEAEGARVLLMGDAGFTTEDALGATPSELEADVLKVGHHGSARSTSELLLGRVQPRHALICCGRRNRFGHPHRPALERLDAAGVSVSRTDEGGMITLRIDKSGVRSESYVDHRLRGQ